MAIKRRVLLVDDHAIMRQGLAQLINGEADLAVSGEVDNIDDAMESVRQVMPDVAIVDISLGGRDGLELIKELKEHHPRLKVLVLSMHDEGLYAERALRAGARGYIMKQEPAERVMAAVRKVLGGEIHLSDAISARVLQRLVASEPGTSVSALERLSDRELEIFRMIGRGMTVREIAEKLYLSTKTVDAHREHIKQKLDIRSSSELLRYAVQRGLD